ncbi:MAG: ATP-binding protein [Brevundimonas sp.]|uniref:ATP-binding protein n=1 Tax=Brevundimonas sp. TaxID=1871086 RepID=UPI002488BF58|nr:ATP-binding protein [Brevundimonas sp.]MDI1325716.1 ATP-binding protein [Brevundimonas sp.]
MRQSLPGFDEAFDRTGVETRSQAGARAAIGVIVFLSGLTAIPLSALLVWAAMYVTGDLTLWIATDPANQRHRPVFFRTLRLAATLVSTCAWVTIGALWWMAPGDYAKAAGVGLIAGVLLYVVRGCHRSLAQMLTSGLPPAIALLTLPFVGGATIEKVGLFTAMALLVAYAVSSGVNAWQGHRRLQRTTLALVQKQQEAEAASVAKTEFLANMSHEIRTPLNGVLAMAHVLHRADLPPREKEAAGVICASGEMLERLLSDVLDLAKVEAGQMTLEVAPFDAGDLTRSVVALCRMRAEEKRVGLAVEIEPAAEGHYLGDTVRVRQVLSNLLSNAVKFTNEGEVRVTLGVNPEGALRFTVADTGVGFEPAMKARLFGRFEQADGSITRRFGGSGLGLAISRSLVEMMGGSLDCDSAPGVGARFWFDLPLPRGAGAKTGVATLAEAVSEAGRTRQLNLLVADDHSTNLKVVEIILADSGVTVTAVTDGLQAVSAHALQTFDLILMDMQMPVMDGLTAVAMIRAAEAASGGRRTPIIMLTANAAAEHAAAGRAAGADMHMTKPISPAGLLSAIAEVTAQAAGPPVGAPRERLAV